MLSTFKSDFASLLLRIAFGTILVIHGLIKWLILTPESAENHFQSLGFPANFFYFVMLIELIAGSCFILGLFTRIFSLIIILEMAVITYAHIDNGFLFNNSGGGWEYPAFMLVVGIVLFILGSGHYSLSILNKKLAKF